MYLGYNKIGKNGVNDLKELLNVPSIELLNLNHNLISDEKVIDEVFSKMENLKVLYI